MSDVRALEERAPLARLRARLGRVNWARLNYVLIPSARSRRPVPHPVGEPASATASRIWSFYRSFTREGRALFVATLITAAFAVDVTHTQVGERHPLGDDDIPGLYCWTHTAGQHGRRVPATGGHLVPGYRQGAEGEHQRQGAESLTERAAA